MEPREHIDAYLDGELPADGEADFRAWLRADPEHRREFVRCAHLHRSLRGELKGQRIRRVESISSAAQKPARPMWRRWAAAAAVLLIAGFCIYKFVIPDPALAFFTARIEKLSGTAYKVDQLSVSRMPARERELLQEKTGLEFDGPGQARLKYFDGTTLDFTAAAAQGALRLHRAADRPQLNTARIGKRLSVENGILAASVASQPEGKPLIISTPQAEVTVVGTRFRLDVNADVTRLDVSEGKVRIVRYADLAGAEVSAGEFVIVNGKDPVQAKRADAQPVK